MGQEGMWRSFRGKVGRRVMDEYVDNKLRDC